MSKANANIRALVRFPLPTTMPAGCEIESATLRLHSKSAKTPRTIQALRVSGTWTESGVTWANQPATNGLIATAPAGLGWREWSVTDHVTAMITSGVNQGWLIRDSRVG
jgi:hypothetical protein